MRRTRVLVADGLPLFHVGVRSLLRRESDFELLEVKPEVRPKILKHNAARLLGLD